jgi:hypothetical protein
MGNFSRMEYPGIVSNIHTCIHHKILKTGKKYYGTSVMTKVDANVLSVKVYT